VKPPAVVSNPDDPPMTAGDGDCVGVDAGVDTAGCTQVNV
jgi:hypothetical protein